MKYIDKCLTTITRMFVTINVLELVYRVRIHLTYTISNHFYFTINYLYAHIFNTLYLVNPKIH